MKKQFFNGRYYKHQKDNYTVCIIEGICSEGEFVQIVTNDKVYHYDTHDGIRINKIGITVDYPEVKGYIQYRNMTPLHYDIMGPFRHLPLQCQHEIVSMKHDLVGALDIEGQYYDFNLGRGYIEGDEGTSFPETYLWFHTNDFVSSTSVMVSIADIPFFKRHFIGCICAITCRGRQYRFATYKGVKIIQAKKDLIELKQGRLRLEIHIKQQSTQPLHSPINGEMIGVIHESNNSIAHVILYKGRKVIFDEISHNCSFEYNMNEDES